MPAWNLDQTRNTVERCYGDGQLALLNPCLASLSDRQDYASYHFHEYGRLLREAIDSKLTDTNIYELTLPRTPEQQYELTTLLKRVGAHIIACIQSLHCLGDTLAHAICYSAGLNIGTNAIPERQISLRRVCAALSHRLGFQDVQAELGALERSPEFSYLSAVANHSKHRSIVEPGLNVGFLDDPGPRYQIKFSRFTYDRTCYEKRDVVEVLEPTYCMLSNAVVDCGNALNSALAAAYP